MANQGSTQGSTDRTLDRASSTAHETVDRVAQTASAYAERFGEKAEEWLEMKDSWVEGTREYVRELKNYVQRAFILADDVIDANLAPAAVAAPESAPLLSVRVGTTLDEVSRRLIEATLAECGSKRKAADMLGISLKTLYNRLAAYKSESESEEDEQDERRAA